MRMQLVLVGAVILLNSGVALGDGSYQRAKNGRTIVWNNDPKPGDEAIWSGDRDGDNYADGFGTLSWYVTRRESGGKTKSVLYARYFGQMMRGKFNGPVNVHSKGKTEHAIFADGQRTNRWTGGPARSWTVAELKTAKRASVSEPAAPAEGPPRQKAKQTNQRSAAYVREQSDHRLPSKSKVKGQSPSNASPGEAATDSQAGQITGDGEKTAESRSQKEEGSTEKSTSMKIKKSPAEVERSLRALVRPPSSLQATPEPAEISN